MVLPVQTGECLANYLSFVSAYTQRAATIPRYALYTAASGPMVYLNKVAA
jgi:hypothetical protein